MVLRYLHCRISFNHSITISWLLLYDDFHIFYCHQTEQFLDQIFSHGNHGFSMENHLPRGFSCPCLCEVPSGEKPDVLIKISIPLSAYIILYYVMLYYIILNYIYTYYYIIYTYYYIYNIYIITYIIYIIYYIYNIYCILHKIYI